MCQKFTQSLRVYITYRRILEIGSAPGCRGCEGDSSNHSNECIARFEEAFGRASADVPPEGAEELEDVPEEIIASGADSPYTGMSRGLLFAMVYRLVYKVYKSC